MGPRSKLPRIRSFQFSPGRVIAGRYVVHELLGAGWEGEVYSVVERRTGIPRAAKLFFPHRNPRDSNVLRQAKKLDRLRDCPIIIQYHHSEELRHRGHRVTVLISELVEGVLLEEFVRSQRSRRLQPFEALHLIYAIICGIEEIHNRGEYHGDLHDGNVLVRRKGIGFQVKLLDFFHRGGSWRQSRALDVVECVRLLYDAVGGRARYASQPPEIKSICLGLRTDLIRRRFPTAGRLRAHLESFDWSG